jgi:hypothetical protein
MFASAKVVRHTCLSTLLAFSLLSAAAYGQVQATLRAETGFPAGQSVAPTVPAGAIVIGSNLWTGDGFDGFRHWIPADPHNPDPINSGILVPDTTLGFSLGGGSACFLFCKVGQVTWDGSSNVYFASYDHVKGNGITFPGIWRAQPDPVTGDPECTATGSERRSRRQPHHCCRHWTRRQSVCRLPEEWQRETDCESDRVKSHRAIGRHVA